MESPFFSFAKYFGSGVIIATAFIHLLDPALDALGSECLTGAWQDYVRINFLSKIRDYLLTCLCVNLWRPLALGTCLVYAKHIPHFLRRVDCLPLGN